MKRFLLLSFCAFLMHAAVAQSTRKIRQLEERRVELQKQISHSESMLQSTKKDVKSQLADLALLTGQISQRKKYIAVIASDVAALQKEQLLLQLELKRLNAELVDKKNKYAKSVRYLYHNRSIQEKLMFIFSAETLGQMYRRLRYVREYADYQRFQALELNRKCEQIARKQEEINATRDEKERLLREGQTEQEKLEEQEKDRKKLLTSLQRKEKSLRSELAKQRQSANQLNKEIDRLIQIEIEKARKRAEEERRKKAAEEARRKASEKRTAEKTTSAPAKPAGTVEVFETDDADRRLAGSFEKNKGRLPMPITGSYTVVGHYGQYQVPGLKNVRLDNKGIDIRGKAGAQARAIFDGEVSAVFQYNGLNNVLVRHGSYISVYCNLSNVSVKKGDRVKTRDAIGTVGADAQGNVVLHFQLRKETSKLNPELWIAR